MTPKEKAEELFNKFTLYLGTDAEGIEYYVNDLEAKQCALIAVDELIKFGNEQGIREPMMYWHKVKEELEKL
jgi:hypothetical protein